MPEFEEENVNASPSESYAPSIDASKKPRTRRRSGGFKTEVVSLSNASIGEVNANQALKEEKLSGTQSATQSHETCESHGDREDRPRRERKPRESRAPRGPRIDANPQPSPETLAAIASVEAKIAERRAERDSRSVERSERKPRKQGDGKPTHKKGLLASILSIFGLGTKEEPTKKRGGNRGGQNRRRMGQNRRRGSQGGRRNNRRSKEKSES